jgi:hypothetical protein
MERPWCEGSDKEVRIASGDGKQATRIRAYEQMEHPLISCQKGSRQSQVATRINIMDGPRSLSAGLMKIFRRYCLGLPIYIYHRCPSTTILVLPPSLAEFQERRRFHGPG